MINTPKVRPPQLIDENKLDKIKQLIPEAISDGKINFEVLKHELYEYLEDDGPDNEHFGLNWQGKKNARRIANFPSKMTIIPTFGDGVDEQKTDNIFIDGENLEILKILHKSYANMIKMIYIDPPYNTGRDFIYNDNFREDINEYLINTGQVDSKGNSLTTNKKSDGRFHSNWLNMMYPRLKVAKDLITQDGVILMSIDDNEVHNAKAILNEIFGEENFLAQVVVESDARSRQYAAIATTHEYLLIYSKNSDFIYKKLRNKNKEFQFTDSKGPFDIYELRNRNVSFNINNRPNLYYPFYVNPSEMDSNGFFQVSLEEKNDWVKTFPQESNGIKTVWRWGKEKAKKNIENLFAKKHRDGFYQVYKKYREDTFVFNSVWTDQEIKTDRGTLQLKELFENKKIFDYAKPIGLLKRILSIFSDESDLILDFFAGSGTLGHAIFQQSIEDKSNKNFILIQMPEMINAESEAYKAGFRTISEICKERLRRAGKKFSIENPDNSVDLGFRSFKLDNSNFKDIAQNNNLGNTQIELDAHLSQLESLLKDGWRYDDLLTEIMLIEGFPLTSKVVHINEFGNCKVSEISSLNCEFKLYICIDENIPDDLISKLSLRDKDIFICLDNAVSDETKIRLADKGLIKTI